MELTKHNHVYFVVLNFGDDPSVVTAILGVEPTKAWTRGQPWDVSRSGGRHTHGRWQLNSRLPLEAEVKLHLMDLLEQLEPLAASISEIAGRFETHIGVATYGGDAGFMLDAVLLGRIAALNIGFDVQTYG